jgi:hypothetical protein
VFAGFAYRRNDDKLYSGLAGAGDDDLFPALDCGDEFGEVGLGVMDVDFHVDRLARLIS